jgi:tetratricopeptide (TPR) repeat protein
MKTTLGLAALAALFAASPTTAQRAAARVPNFLAVSFHSPGEPSLGVDVAEAVRQRMLRYFPMPPIRTLRVLRREEINNTLMVSGFAADTIISPTDLGILSKQLGAEETMDGTAKRTAEGVEARAKFYFNGNMAAPEVLPVVTEKNAESAGKKIAELYVKARKELPAYERCKNALIQSDADQAIVAAKEAMEIYPEGVLGRACLITAYSPQYKNFPADSLIKLGSEITAVDPDNTIAISQLADAYRVKGDTASAVKLITRLSEINDQQAPELIDPLVQLGAPGKALIIIEGQLKQNPGDVPMIEKQWKLLQLMNNWKDAIAAGEQMVKFDSSKADTNYFRRQIGAAFQDSQPQLALAYMAKATAKFPTDTLLLQAQMGELRRQGQVPQAIEVAKKLAAINRATGNATVIALYAELKQMDSAIVFAKQALVGADSATKDQIGQGLLAVIRPAMVKAQADTGAAPEVRKANWAEVLKMSAAVDSIVPNPNTAFYMSVAAFNVAQFGLSNFTETARTNRPAACAMLKEASDNLLIVDLNMSRGGRVDPATAGALLRATSELKPGIEQGRRQLNCR